MAFDQCMDVVRKAFGDEKIPKNLEDAMALEVERLIKKYNNLNDPDPGAAALRELDAGEDELAIANKIRQRNTALNTRKHIENLDYVRTVWGDRPIDGIRAILRSSPIPRVNAGNSVVRAQAARADFLVVSLYHNLSEKNLFKLWASGEFDADIHRAMWQIDGKKVDTTTPIRPEAIEMAKEIRKSNEYARQQANQHGAAIGTLDGFVTTRATDSLKVRADAEGWLKFTDENLDYNETFADVDIDNRLNKLEQMRSDFISNSHIALDAPATSSALTGFGNVGKSMSHERVLHFKTPEAEAEYAKRFGTGNMSKAVMFNLERMGADTAVMEHLGPNAKQNLDRLFLDLQKDAKRNLDDGLREELDKYKNFVDHDLWPQISGEARGVENHVAARASSVVAGVQQMSSLGSAMLSMFSDLAVTASEIHYQGQSFLGGVAKSTGALLEGTPKGERMAVLQSLGVLADGIKGDVIGRFTSGDMMPGRLASSVQMFFKYTGIQAWPDRVRNGFAQSMSNWLATNTQHTHANLPNEVQRMLRIGGFDENVWNNVLRQSVKDVEGTKFFVPEALDDIPDASFERVLTNTGVTPSKAKVVALRQEIAEKTRTLFQDRIINAVVEGDAQTRAALVGGRGQGSWSRVIRGHLTMFKTFPVSVIEKPVARFVKGMDESGKFTASGFAGLAQMLVAMTALGYVSMAAKDAVKGVSPRDPSDPKTWMAAFTQGGGAGLYGDFLFGEANRFGGGIISSLAGPTAGDISKIHDLYMRVRDGDDAAAQAFKLLVSNTPGNNVFYAKAALDYLIVHGVQESLNPGYLKRLERRLEKDNEQRFFFPPSEQ
ncbi:hypothetical protein N9878_00545 [bacterium]|nr:hypothetical protein [bacterium]